METVYSRLRQWRFEYARGLNLPSFFILSNRHLSGVAAAMPATLEELAACPGVGPKKLAQFGEQLLKQIALCAAEGLESGVEVPVAVPAGPAPEQLSDEDMAAIATALRRELAHQVARRLKGRFTATQVEDALRRLSITA